MTVNDRLAFENIFQSSPFPFHSAKKNVNSKDNVWKQDLQFAITWFFRHGNAFLEYM